MKEFLIHDFLKEDSKNFSIIKNIVSEHWGYDDDSIERFKKRIDVLDTDENYLELLEDSVDRRIRWKIKDDYLEVFDRGWANFRKNFSIFVDYYDLKYINFRNNKVVINKNSIKLRKAILNYYSTLDTYNGARFADLSIESLFKNEKDKEKGNNDYKKLEKKVDMLLEAIGTKSIPKKGLELVLSLNFADWFLASTSESWESCLNLESNYEGAYWSGLPGTIIDKNRAMIYITDGKTKSYKGIVVDKIISRTWVLLSNENVLNVVNWYPSKFISEDFLYKITDIKFEDVEDSEFISKYSIKKDMLYFKNEKSSFIYQDNAVLNNKGYFIGSKASESNYWTKWNDYLESEEVFSYEEGLNYLISNGYNLNNYEYEDESYYCESCNERMSEDESYFFEGSYYCESCYYDRVSTCSECGREVNSGEIFYFENETLCESCYVDNIVSCDNCGTEIRFDDAFSIDGNHYCNDNCAEKDGYKECKTCHNLVHENESIEVNGNHYCDDNCAEKDGYKECKTCYELKKETIHLDMSNEQICKECLQKEIDRNQNFLDFENKISA